MSCEGLSSTVRSQNFLRKKQPNITLSMAGLHSQLVVSLQKQTSARVVRNMFLHPHASKELLVKPSCVDKTCPGACRRARKWAWADLATPPQKGKRANQDPSAPFTPSSACLIQVQWQMSDHAPGVCTSLRMDRKLNFMSAQTAVQKGRFCSFHVLHQLHAWRMVHWIWIMVVLRATNSIKKHR